MTDHLRPEVVDQRPYGWSRFNDEIVRGPLGKIIGPYGVSVYIVLLTFANDKTNVCWPSMPTIAGALGISDRQVQRSLKVLADAGLIRIERRFREDGSPTSNRYHLLPVEAPLPPSREVNGGPDEVTVVNQVTPDEVTVVNQGGVSVADEPKSVEPESVEQECVSRKRPEAATPLHTHPEKAQAQALITALSDLTREPAGSSSFKQTLFYLVEHQARPDDLDQFGVWFKTRFLKGRETSGDPPTTRQVHQLWLRFEDWQRQQTKPRPGRAKPPQTPEERKGDNDRAIALYVARRRGEAPEPVARW